MRFRFCFVWLFLVEPCFTFSCPRRADQNSVVEHVKMIEPKCGKCCICVVCKIFQLISPVDYFGDIVPVAVLSDDNNEVYSYDYADHTTANN